MVGFVFNDQFVDQLLKTSEVKDLYFTEPVVSAGTSGLFSRSYTLIFVMRVSIFYVVLLICSLQLLLANSGNGQSIDDIKVTVGLRKGENLERLFKNIEKQSGLLFAYDYEKVNQYKDITLA